MVGEEPSHHALLPLRVPMIRDQGTRPVDDQAQYSREDRLVEGDDDWVDRLLDAVHGHRRCEDGQQDGSGETTQGK